jgi:hypothetical protein
LATMRAAYLIILSLWVGACQSPHSGRTTTHDRDDSAVSSPVTAPNRSVTKPSASASGSAADPAPPAPLAAFFPSLGELDEFFDAMLRSAQSGVIDLVRIPVWRCGPSCTCPPPCLSIPGTESSHWIEFATRPPRAAFPILSGVRRRTVRAAEVPAWSGRIVTGFFTGRSVQRDIQGQVTTGEGVAPSWSVWEFYALDAEDAPELTSPAAPWDDLPERLLPRRLPGETGEPARRKPRTLP